MNKQRARKRIKTRRKKKKKETKAQGKFGAQSTVTLRLNKTSAAGSEYNTRKRAAEASREQAPTVLDEMKARVRECVLPELVGRK